MTARRRKSCRRPHPTWAGSAGVNWLSSRRLFHRLLALLLLMTPFVRADLLPADEEAIPRLVELREVERFGDYLLILQNCYTRFSVDDGATLPYCVVVRSAPFVTGGKLWLLPRAGVELAERNAAPPSTERWRAEEHRMPPVALLEPRVNIVDPDAFFATEARLVKTDVDFGFRDHVAVKLAMKLSRVTESYRVTRVDQAGVTLEPLGVRWHCRDGRSIDAAPTSSPGRIGSPPSCDVPRSEPPTAPAPPAPAPRWPYALAALLLGAGATLWYKTRR